MRTRQVVEKVPSGSRPVPSVGEVKLPNPEVASNILASLAAALLPAGCQSPTIDGFVSRSEKSPPRKERRLEDDMGGSSVPMSWPSIPNLNKQNGSSVGEKNWGELHSG